jgi:hypothetical protein
MKPDMNIKPYIETNVLECHACFVLAQRIGYGSRVIDFSKVSKHCRMYTFHAPENPEPQLFPLAIDKKYGRFISKFQTGQVDMQQGKAVCL